MEYGDICPAYEGGARCNLAVDKDALRMVMAMAIALVLANTGLMGRDLVGTCYLALLFKLFLCLQRGQHSYSH